MSVSYVWNIDGNVLAIGGRQDGDATITFDKSGYNFITAEPL